MGSRGVFHSVQRCSTLSRIALSCHSKLGMALIPFIMNALYLRKELDAQMNSLLLIGSLVIYTFYLF